MAEEATTIAEFKLKGDGPWEQTAVYEAIDYRELPLREPSSVAHWLADKHGVEVRWNWKGDQRGHYVSPQSPVTHSPM